GGARLKLVDGPLAARSLQNEITGISMAGPRISSICTADTGPRTRSTAAPRRPRARASRPEHGLPGVAKAPGHARPPADADADDHGGLEEVAAGGGCGHG